MPGGLVDFYADGNWLTVRHRHCASSIGEFLNCLNPVSGIPILPWERSNGDFFIDADKAKIYNSSAKLYNHAFAMSFEGSLHWQLIKGETLSPYYWNRLERTRATMQGHWLSTGDMFARDAEGFFTFAGRSDDRNSVGRFG